jgi:uncharacterized OB-fold protein
MRSHCEVRKYKKMNIAQNWRLNDQRYALKGVRCEGCNQVLFPPREVCPDCRERAEQQKAAERMEAKLAERVAVEVEVRR